MDGEKGEEKGKRETQTDAEKWSEIREEFKA